MLKIYTLVLLCLWTSSILYAQHTISGKIIDAQTREALPGVHVMNQETQQGTITDQQGNFELIVLEKTAIIFSLIGYQKQTVVPNDHKLTVLLAQSLVELNQIIVSASRESQSRTDAPMAIGKLSPKLLEETKPASLEQVVNKVSGVFMVNLGNEQHSSGK